MLERKAKFHLKKTGRFIIEDYNWAEAQSNFLPGIAGPWGVPLWSYYVNRGQAVASLGLGDKDGQILPFESFNLACEHVGRRGFRTFVRLNNDFIYEPFRKTRDTRIRQKMIQDAGELQIEDFNHLHGLETKVTFFTIPNFSHGLFVRSLNIRNASKNPLRYELLDGVSRIIPFGVGYERSVFIARHIEAMMGVHIINGAALYRLNQTAADVERVESIGGGNFYLPLLDRKSQKKGLITDPDAVFGESSNYERPWVFENKGLEGVLGQKQIATCKTPCGFGATSGNLKGGEDVTLVSLLGYVKHDEDISEITKAVSKKRFLKSKREENRTIIEEIENYCFTASDSPELDAYSGRNFLDNVLRGGLPNALETASGKTSYYLYSRQNGDLERDYHWFVLQPSYLSQGTGHYRSILQNRRCDTWFFPEVEDDNLFLFMNLIQLDGYNPLEVGSLKFKFQQPEAASPWLDKFLTTIIKRFGEKIVTTQESVKDGKKNVKAGKKLVEDGKNPIKITEKTKKPGKNFEAHGEAHGVDTQLIISASAREQILDELTSGYYPGELILELEKLCRKIVLKQKHKELFFREDLLSELLERSVLCEVGDLHEGFWVDHWTYNLDLLDLYLAIYPDRLHHVFFGRHDYTFFDNPDIVLPRSRKTLLREDEVVRRYGAVKRDPEKEQMISLRSEYPYKVRIKGKKNLGELYKTNLFVKFLVIIANRIATLDPFGRGLEMEADKPGWNDSLNGLPSLFGSSTNETLELLRCVRCLKDALEKLSGEENAERTKKMEAGEEAGVAASNKTTKDRKGCSETTVGSISIYKELNDFILKLSPLLESLLNSSSEKSKLTYWDKANSAKEEYREMTRLGVDGVEVNVGAKELLQFLNLCDKNLSRIFEVGKEGQLEHVMSSKGVPYTYFINEVSSWDKSSESEQSELQTVEPTAWRQRPVRLFLEGPVHYMKLFPAQADRIYRAVKKSPLYDRKLKMYKSCVNMQGEDPEIGRAVGAYPPGWIENESIYLHMEYKYLLEILRSGLCEEYFQDMKTTVTAFMDPLVYGRNPLEGASFLVSSAFADIKHHGQAFQPRLSGITCEFVHIWTLMVAGPNPFQVTESGELRLALQPRLPGWLFTKRGKTRRYYDPVEGLEVIKVANNRFAFKFLGTCLVIYENNERRDTFGPKRCRPSTYVVKYRDEREDEIIEGEFLSGPAAHAVRDGDVKRLEVVLS